MDENKASGTGSGITDAVVTGFEPNEGSYSLDIKVSADHTGKSNTGVSVITSSGVKLKFNPRRGNHAPGYGYRYRAGTQLLVLADVEGTSSFVWREAEVVIDMGVTSGG